LVVGSPAEAQPPARVLIVDDEEITRNYLGMTLRRAGYRCDACGTGREALPLLLGDEYDLALVDLVMPGMSGQELLSRLARERASEFELALVVVSGETDIDAAMEAVKLGADDYIRKPMTREELLLGVSRALDRRRLIMENRNYQKHLEEMVRQQSDKIQNSLLKTIEALSRTLGAKDTYSLSHSRRVMELAAGTARELGLEEAETEKIRVGALLHDIGKLGVKDGILNKDLPLEEEEVDHIHQHPLVAETILGPIEELREIIGLIRHHHERWDGGGYPDGLAGAGIPRGATIIAVADAYDAMTSARVYNRPLAHPQALAELRRGAGSQFSPDAVAAFCRAFPEAPPAPA